MRAVLFEWMSNRKCIKNDQSEKSVSNSFGFLSVENKYHLQQVEVTFAILLRKLYMHTVDGY